VPSDKEPLGFVMKRLPEHYGANSGIAHVHKQTFFNWLDSLPVDEAGWVDFSWTELQSFKYNGTFFRFKAINLPKR